MDINNMKKYKLIVKGNKTIYVDTLDNIDRSTIFHTSILCEKCGNYKPLHYYCKNCEILEHFGYYPSRYRVYAKNGEMIESNDYKNIENIDGDKFEFDTETLGFYLLKKK